MFERHRIYSTLVVTLTAVPFLFFQNCASSVNFGKDEAEVMGAACSFQTAPESLNREREETLMLRLTNTGNVPWMPGDQNTPTLAQSVDGSSAMSATPLSPAFAIQPGDAWLTLVRAREHLEHQPGESVTLNWTMSDSGGFPMGVCQRTFSVTGPSDFNSELTASDVKSPMNRKSSEMASFSFQNIGLKPWTRGEVILHVESQANFSVDIPLPVETVYPGAIVDFAAEIRAPDGMGPLGVRATMRAAGTDFGSKYDGEVKIDDAANSPIDGTGPKLTGALFNNRQYDVTVTMLNTGSSTWLPGYYVLTEAARNDWNFGEIALTQNIQPGASYTFPVRVTTPMIAAGTCNNLALKVQMRNKSRGYAFGVPVSVRGDMMDNEGNLKICGPPVGDFTYSTWGPLELFQVGAETFGKQTRTESCGYSGGCQNPQPKVQYVASWTTNESLCDRTCGGGTKAVTSVPLTWTPTANGTPRPASTQACNVFACLPTGPFSYGAWGPAVEYALPDGTHAKQTRTESCPYAGGCNNPQPKVQYAASWTILWSTACSATCGGGNETGIALPATWTYTAEGAAKPPGVRACNTQACPPTGPFDYGAWGPTQFFALADGTHAKQTRTQSCNFAGGCTSPQPTEQFVSAWSVVWTGSCSATCGGGTESGTAMATAWSYTSPGAPSPAVTRSCNTQACPPVCAADEVLVNGVCRCAGLVPDNTGCMRATCTGFNSSPRVNLTWCNDSSHPPTYEIQKGGQEWGTGTYFWWMSISNRYATSFTDYNGYPAAAGSSQVIQGQTYGYRTKCNNSNTGGCVGRTMTVQINRCFCSP